MDNKKPALAGLGGRMKGLVALALIIPCAAMAQKYNDGIQELLDAHWQELGSKGSTTFYIADKNITPTPSGAYVHLKAVTVLNSGRRIAINSGSFPCSQTGGAPNSFFSMKSLVLLEDSSGRSHLSPDSLVGQSPGYSMQVEAGSVLSEAANIACGDTTASSVETPEDKQKAIDEIFRKLDAAKAKPPSI